jgi:acyl-CoA reductase-like NAD-dependent aldehyde dehydrogenase
MTQLDKRDYAQLVARTFSESASVARFTRKSQAHDTHYGLSVRIPDSTEGRRELICRHSVGQYVYGFAERPFGGVRESGMGREQRPQALDEFTDTKSILPTRGPRRMWVPESKAIERQ